MKIGIYCGSFAPVHKGHITFVKEVLKSKIVDKVLIVPTISYWDKEINISLKDRINMLKLYETKKIEIETKLNNVKSTYEGFTKYQKKHPKDELYLILGTDNIVNFEKWINYQKMLEYPFIILKRKPYTKKYIVQRMKDLNKTNYYILNTKTIDISSTYIRENIDKPKLIKDKVDNKVYKYLKENITK